MKVIFRCDASPLIGSGHVMRCLTLADKMQLWEWEVHFCVSKETLETLPLLKEKDVSLLFLENPSDDLTVLPSYCTDNAIDLLLIDHYARGQDFEISLRKSVKSIAVIDDLADRMHDCDALIDQTLGRSRAEYQPLTPPQCRILTGTDYAILAPQYGAHRIAAIKKRQNTKEIETILVSLGSTNLNNCTGFALSALARYKAKPLNIDVVLGGAARDLDEVTHQIHSMNENTIHNVRLHINAMNMHELMLRADLAIGAGGTTSWERCCLALPSLMIEIADNQRFVAKALHDQGAAYNLGLLETLTPDDLLAVLTRSIDAPQETRKMAEICSVLCNGRGADHILPALIPSVLLKNNRDLTLRFMNLSDTNIIHQWQSHPGLRQYSRNSAVPSLEEHKNWMAASLNNTARYPYMIEQDQTPVGIIRLDKIPEEKGGEDSEGNRYEISILVAPNATKQGIAAAAHGLLRTLHPKIEIIAEVHPDNSASHALFERLGYVPLSGNQFVLTP